MLTQFHETTLKEIVTASRITPGVDRPAIKVLFTGTDTEGKRLAARLLAGALGKDLHRVDLSRLVSKYIGETEKNLRQVFESATARNVLLFFDEADALFGKRSEVKDSHDRYANLEVSYLLQQIESHHGIAILAINRQRHIDEALLRRCMFVLNFGEGT